MSENFNHLSAELEKFSEDARNTFGRLSPAQINWKPGADGWSVGQCFEHLIKSNALFFPDLDKIAAGTRQSSLLEKFSPLSSVWANLLISSLKKDTRKFKTPTKKIVPPSEIDAQIIGKFTAHQNELIKKIKLTEMSDWRKTKVTSPFLKIATYKLADGFQIIIEHEKRHFRQAERVIQNEDFPK